MYDETPTWVIANDRCCSLEPKLDGMRVAELATGTVLLRDTLTVHKNLGAIDIGLLCGST